MKILETRRLLLRHSMLNDLEDLKTLYADPGVGLALASGDSTPKESLRAMLMAHTEEFRREGIGLLSVVNPELGQVVGQCGLRRQTIDGNTSLVLQCAINASARRDGLGAEACAAVIHYASEELPSESMIALVDEKNVGALKLATKLGLVRTGEVDRGGRTLAIFTPS
ncbi:MAG: GNAT family N-acetyltransferase [Planctomycetota bacterium]|nr:GNAT family N-acetyltransferase [Planctomycetota bacterium]